jgi:hypothetical protein
MGSRVATNRELLFDHPRHKSTTDVLTVSQIRQAIAASDQG